MINLKKIMPFIGGSAVLITILFTRYMISNYGEVSRVIIATVALIISAIALIGIIYTKKYLAAFGAFIMLIPGVVITIGIYVDNLYICAVGLLLVFILIPIMLKILNAKIRHMKE